MADLAATKCAFRQQDQDYSELIGAGSTQTNQDLRIFDFSLPDPSKTGSLDDRFWQPG